MVDGVLQAQEAYIMMCVCVCVCLGELPSNNKKKLKCNYSESYTVPQAVHAAFFALQFASVVLH
jgi:hypothetical protein